MERTETLDRLGDALEAAAQRDLATRKTAAAANHRGRGARSRGARAGSGGRGRS